MTYQEHINRVLAKHHARLEMGLAQARKQARFVERVADIFIKIILFTRSIFYLPEFSGCLKRVFPHFWVERDGAEWVICNPKVPDVQVIIRLGVMS